jgi:diacylglycerol kinase family enzyme
LDPHAHSRTLLIDYVTNGNAGRGTERQGLGANIARMLRQTAFDVRVHATSSLEELDHAARSIAQRRPDILAVDGGDGTLNVVFSRILREYVGLRQDELPLILYVPTGTMRLVGSSLGLTEQAPEELVDDVLRLLSSGGRRVFGDKTRVAKLGGDLPVVRSNILRFTSDQHDTEYGFIWGAGIPVNFLELYYAEERRGHAGAGRVLFETMTDEIVSAILLSESQKLLTRPVHGRAILPDAGELFPRGRTTHTAIMASAVEEIGFGFKGMPLARSESGKFMVRATERSFFDLVAMAPMLALGTPVPGMHDAVTDTVTVQWLEPTATTIDGEMRTPHLRDVISCGPELRFLRP